MTPAQECHAHLNRRGRSVGADAFCRIGTLGADQAFDPRIQV
jgi:hypothetical protein